MEEGGVEEQAMDDEQTDRDISREENSREELQEEYKSEGNEVYHSREKYSSKKDKSNSEKEKNRKSTSKKEGLEAVVNSLTKEARASGIDETEYFGAHLHENLSNYLEEGDGSGEEGTSEGVFAIIYNKETGEFLLGVRPPSYFKRYRGRLSCIGGGIEPKDFSPLEAQAREIDEEVEDMEAKKILKRELRVNGVYLGEMTDSFYGEIFKTHWYELPVPIEVWDKVKRTRLRDDAGTTYIGTFDDILSRRDNDFVFDNGSHGKKLKELILEKIVTDKGFLKHYNHPNSNYTLPTISTNYKPLQTINPIMNLISPSIPYNENIPLKLAA